MWVLQAGLMKGYLQALVVMLQRACCILSTYIKDDCQKC